MPNLLKYKKEILLTIFGALVGGVISLSVGNYNLFRSFELTQEKERRATLRKDIITLRQVERELDKNLLLLLNQDFRPDIQFENASNSSKLKGLSKELSGISRLFLGEGQILSKYIMPKDGFVMGAWIPYPVSSEINFDLTEQLTDFYRKTDRVNYFLNEIRRIIGYNPVIISETASTEVKRLIDQIKTEVSDISKDKIINLKNKVNSEIKSLEKEFSKMK